MGADASVSVPANAEDIELADVDDDDEDADAGVAVGQTAANGLDGELDIQLEEQAVPVWPS